jgi:hypothetical protein
MQQEANDLALGHERGDIPGQQDPVDRGQAEPHVLGQ